MWIETCIDLPLVPMESCSSKDVLLFFGDGKMLVGYLFFDVVSKTEPFWSWCCAESGEEFIHNPTHWMPLPHPPTALRGK